MQKDTPKTFKKRTAQAAAREYEYDAAAGQLVYADGARLTAFIAPDEVQKLLGCSRTVAREHLKSAGAVCIGGGQLRVAAKDWDHYARTTLGIHSRILLLRQRWACGAAARPAPEHRLGKRRS